LQRLEAHRERKAFGPDEFGFVVEYRRLDKTGIEQVINSALRTERGRDGVDKQRTDVTAWRRALADSVLCGWSGLTERKVALLCNRDPGQLNGSGDTMVPFSIENAIALMEMARVSVKGSALEADQLLTFEDFVWDCARETAAATAKAVAVGKGGSASMPEGS
jgi:hypothetical protein